MFGSQNSGHAPWIGQSGTLDGAGGGDHDSPYRFGRLPRAVATFPFTTRQFARLLVFRSRYQARRDFSAQRGRLMERTA